MAVSAISRSSSNSREPFQGQLQSYTNSENIMLTEAVKESIEESVLCWLATVSEDGEPNCSPKETFLAFSDTELLIADIASPNSRNNILANSQVCVSFVHVLKQKGF